MAIAKKTVEEIRSRCDIVDIIGASVPLKKAGASFKALCPFHHEKTPSFHVNPQRQIFHCFGCHVGGDVFKFVMLRENVDFITAVRLLAEKSGVRIDEEESEGRKGDKSLLFKIHDEVAALYRDALESREGTAAREYLGKRDLAGRAAKDFLIGYAPNAWDTVLKWGEKRGYGPDILEEAGLVLRKSSGREGPSAFYDRFRNRVMFPISDEQGRVVGFSGRTLDENDKAAKYVNSPDTLLFHKSRILYALDKAKTHILDAHEAIICEGQIDVIRCHIRGFQNAVAAQGTAFTEEHARIIRRYADGVILLFDSDSAGKEATIRAAEVFLRAGLTVRAASLPLGEDPDSFLRKNGAERFKDVLRSAVSPVAFQISLLLSRENMRSEQGFMRVAHSVVQLAANSPDSIQRTRLLDEAALMLGVSKTALEDEIRRVASSRRTRDAEQEIGIATPSDATEPPQAELDLCIHLVQSAWFSTTAEVIERYLPLAMITDSRCRVFIEAAIRAAHRKVDVQEELCHYDDPDGSLSEFVARVLMAPPKACRQDGSLERAVEEMILYFWRERLKAEKAALERKILSTDHSFSSEDETRLCQITHDIKALRSWGEGSLVIRMLVKS